MGGGLGGHGELLGLCGGRGLLRRCVVVTSEMCIYISIYTYIYIYIHGERERDRCIYIYIYIEREREIVYTY